MLETKIDAKKAALLIVDMENDFIMGKDGAPGPMTKAAESKGIVGNITRVVAAARGAKIPIVYIRQMHRADNADVVPTVTDAMLQGRTPPRGDMVVEGTPGTDIINELKPSSGDYIIDKRRPNAFYNTDLELLLRSRGVDTVILTGVITNVCIVSTFLGARERDMNALVVSDSCAAVTPEDDEYLLGKFFPRFGRVRTADEVIQAIAAK